MQRLASVGLLVLFASASTLAAQTCGAGQTLLKNDGLPATGGGSAQVSVIQGLCEGEAAGAVFDVSGLGSSLRVNSAAVGLFAGGGANGNQIQGNLRLYDGITWNGGIPTLGPLVYDYTVSTGAGLGLTSSGINELDISAENVIVTSGKLVVTWWSLVNIHGSCNAGFTTNFATDNTCAFFNCPCSSGTRKNLIFIEGQGWRDTSTATVLGFPICGGLINAYNGNWIIRACVEPIGCQPPQNLGPGTQGTGGIVPVLSASGGNAQIGNAGFGLTVAAARGGTVAALLFGIEYTLPFAGGFLYVGPTITVPLPLGGPAGTPGAGFGTLPLPLPNDPTLIGVPLPAQAAVVDAARPFPIALTNGIRIVIC